eukprot:TRINITY_DN4962_c0_g2_i2.p1 TRINITY_DN4962_c0_g2~~TRINITY_DN4962_c0_g2_i2.p1  ORF type:complete len:159 (-),score=20.22 TRINITY_DN4962_c0_g2_i2:23-499(-)
MSVQCACFFMNWCIIRLKRQGFIQLFQTVTQEPSPKLPRARFSKELRNFIGKCLEKESEKRHSARMLLRHQFLEDVGDLDEPFIWPWDKNADRDIQDLTEIADVLGKTVFKKNLYRRSKENSAIFGKIAESLSIPASDAQTILERNLPLKALAESPFR